MSQNPKRLPSLNKSKPLPSKGGSAVVLEMLANKMANFERQPNEEAFIIPLEKLEPNPDQPRRARNEERDRELAADIEARGVLQPILVRSSKNGKYEIIAGERRFQGAMMAGLKEVPVILKDYDDEQARYVSMVENLQRQDLDPLDEGRYYDILNIQENISVRDIAGFIHRSPNYVQERLTRYREFLVQSTLENQLSPADSEENHKRPEKVQKLQKSQSKPLVPDKAVNRFELFLTETQGRISELKADKRQNLAERLRDLRRKLETLEYELLNGAE